MLEDVRKPSARRRGFTAVAAVVVAAIAGTSLYAVLRQPALPQDLHEELTARVTAVLEESSLEEHQHHGHHFEEDAGKIVCAVDPFGVAPEGARNVAEVEWVYARHMCAITGPGTGWAESVRVAGPLAVHFGHHAEVRVPAAGPGYPERVKELIPPRLHEEAFADFGDDAVLDTARERFERARADR